MISFVWHISTVFLNDAICFLVDHIPTRCPKITFGSWTRLPNHVWGMISWPVPIISVKFRMKMKTVSFAGCLEYAKRGRHCVLLLWSWTFPYWHSSLYCCKLLHFWLVSPSEPSYTSTFSWNLIIDINRKSFPFRLKKSLPEKVQKRTETSLLTALISASCATLTCYPLDTVRRQMQMRGTPYKTVLEAISGTTVNIR